MREHALLLASGTLTYTFENSRIAGHACRRHRDVLGPLCGPIGSGPARAARLRERFRADARRREDILVEPGGFLYKDSSVTMELTQVNFKGSSTPTTAPAEAPGHASAWSGGGRARRTPGALRPAASRAHGSKVGPERRGAGLGGRQLALRWRSPGGGRQPVAGGGGSTFMRLKGPGRLGVQSMFMEHKSE